MKRTIQENEHKHAFCAGCGLSFDSSLPQCPHCGSKQRLRKGALICERR